jgi:Domain of unknown function (DUF4166)
MNDSMGWLYPRLLRDTWDSLPEAIRSAHFSGERIRLRGLLEVEVGNTRLARLLRRVFRLPAQGELAPTTLGITGGPDSELWCREIGKWRLSTVQTARQGKLREKVGCLEFEFRLTPEGDCLYYMQERLWIRLLGLRLVVPRWLALEVAAAEAATQAPFCTEIVVQLRAPGSGLLVAYRGKLRRED